MPVSRRNSSLSIKGAFLVQADESAAQTVRMTFTATGNNTCVWGSKRENYNAFADIVEPVTIDGQQLKGFKYVPASLDYPEFSNGDIKLTAIVPPINEQFINNVWYTSMSNLGAFGQMYWGYCNTNVMPVINGAGYDGTLDYCYFGLTVLITNLLVRIK